MMHDYLIADIKDGRTCYWSTAKGENVRGALDAHVEKMLSVGNPSDNIHATRLRDEDSVRFAVAKRPESRAGHFNQVPITGIYFFDVESVSTHVIKAAT